MFILYLGSEFVNEVNRTLTKLLSIDHRVAAAYNPRCNGLVERQNRTTQKALVACLLQKQSNWFYCLPSLKFAFNTSVHSSTKQTPFTMMFNRLAVTPTDIMHYPLDKIHDAPEDVDSPWENARDLVAVSKHLEQMEKVRVAVMDDATLNIRAAQEYQTKSFNARRVGKPIGVGDMILIHNTAERERVAKNLAFPWFGPYQVVKVYENGNLKVKNPKTGHHLKAKVPAARAQHYRLREQFLPSCKAKDVGTAKHKLQDDKPEVVQRQVYFRYFATLLCNK